MSFWRGAALYAALVLFFLIANRGAYKGYFNDDDLDNLVQTRGAEVTLFAEGLVSPKLSPTNFRPVGHFFYKAMGPLAGLHYTPYVAVLQTVHLLNVLLLWFVLRRLGAPPVSAAAGVLFYAFHMACFDGYWKPMFIFDVGCAAFLLISLLLYLRGHWLLALIPFWIAYKTKEPAVMLPAVLLLYEFVLGERRWKRVLPYLGIAALFSVQAVLQNHGTDNDYTLRFTAAALWATFSFYSSKVLLLPYAGAALLLLLLRRDRRVLFGLGALVILMGPMWFLPGRLFGVYLYIPLLGLAIAFAFLTENWKPAWIALFFAVWIPWNYYWLREQRRTALTIAFENRPYVEALGQFLRGEKNLNAVLYDGGPSGMRNWGIEGAIRWFLPDPELKTGPLEDQQARQYLQSPQMALISWDPIKKHLITSTRHEGQADPAQIVMATGNPVWLLGDGWYPLENGFRWIKPTATAHLTHPAAAKEFFVRINLGPVQFKDQGRVELELFLDGRSQGTRVYDQVAWLERRWPVPSDLPATVEVTIRSVNPYNPTNGDPRTLGAAIAGFGFVE
ncbi:MAG: hypothetical protein J0H49_10100 [Acidobacteria bacterium]|nr:hypothetical protein [Acidobacteriota bacterium]